MMAFYFLLSAYFFYKFLSNRKSYDLINYRQIYTRFKGKFATGNLFKYQIQNETDDSTILRTFQRRYPGMRFEFKHHDRVEAVVGLDYDQSKAGKESLQDQRRNRMYGMLQRGVAKRY